MSGTPPNPLERINGLVATGFSVRVFIPWFIFVCVAAACLAVWYQQSTDNVKNPSNTENDCVYGPWSTWTGCENDNCYATGVRTRNILQQANGGTECNTQSLVQTQSCATILNCANPNCQYSPWSQWSECPKTCYHSGENCSNLPEQARYRTVVRGPLPGGLPCDWTTLIERQQCPVGSECVPNQNCVASGPVPSQDCPLCPETGCTLTSQSYFVFCTRSILQPASGSGAQCTPDQLLYSLSCPLPDCTASCEAQNFDAFRTCSNVCGPGLQIASDTVCPNLTTTNCNNGDCPTGALDISAYGTCTNPTAGVSCTVYNVSECMARCVMDDNCTVFYSTSTAYYYGDSISMGCAPSAANEIVYEWVPSSTNCITPTWEMVNAVCLYLCDDLFPSFSINRGFAFPFYENEEPIQSCPITVQMLSFSGACPILGSSTSPNLPYGYMYADSNGSYTRSFTDADTGDTWILECQASTDCVYQSWSDAPPWGICSEDCVLGQGVRTRTRAIVSPSYFLGAPCDIAEQIEYSNCNRSFELDSATLMFCSNSVATTLENVSEYLCQDLCQSWSTYISPNLCNSIQLLYSSKSTPLYEVFLFSWSASVTDATTADAVYSMITSAYPQVVPANVNDMQNAFDSGFQACLPGWYENTGFMSSFLPIALEETYPATMLDCPSQIYAPYVPVYLQSSSDAACYYKSNNAIVTISTSTQRPALPCSTSFALHGSECSRTTEMQCEFGYIWDAVQQQCIKQHQNLMLAEAYEVGEIMQQPNIGGCAQRGVNLALGEGTPWFFVVGDKRSVPSDIFMPFFTAYSNSTFAPSYSFATQVFQDELTCSLFPQRTDGLLNDRDCIPLGSATRTVVPDVYFSNLVDKPCNEARDCSLSDWIDISTCSFCKPPNEYVQVRNVVQQASDGGIPCSDYVTYQVLPCPGPECVQPVIDNLCLCGNFSQSCAPNACEGMSQSAVLPFTASWNLQYIYNYAYSLSFYTPPRNAFTGLANMVGNIQMPYDLAIQQNAQCVDSNGNAPTCYPIFSLPDWTQVEGSYELIFDPVSGSASGWQEGHLTGACNVDAGLVSCLESRVVSYPIVSGTQSGGYVWTLTGTNVGTWTCPLSVCPYMLECCAFTGSCNCEDGFGSGSQSVNAPVLETLTCPASTGFQECTLYEACPNPVPNCATSLTCPIGCDGTPCNLDSGYGSCTLNQAGTEFFCSCTRDLNGLGPDCDFLCPRGLNGLVCSGQGSCTQQGIDFVCSCSAPNIGGPTCDQVGNAYGAVLETLLYTSTMQVPFMIYQSFDSTTTLTNFVAEGSNTVQISNFLPCDDLDNPYCEPFFATCSTNTQGSADPTLDAGIPFFQYYKNPVSINPSQSNLINICVNGDNASVDNQNATYIPIQTMQYRVPPPDVQPFVQCSDLPVDEDPFYRFTIPAVFTSHSSIPPYLQNKRFFTRCHNMDTNTTNTFDTVTYEIGGGSGIAKKNVAPCQYFGCVDSNPLLATDSAKLFSLLESEKTLAEFCAGL